MRHLLDRRSGFVPVDDPGGESEWQECEVRVRDERNRCWVRIPGPQTEGAARRFCRAAPERYVPYRISTVRRATRLELGD